MNRPVAEGALRRRLGLALLTLYSVGVMVGAGLHFLVRAMAGATATLTAVA